MTDDNGLPNAMALLLKHMRDDYDAVNNDMLSIDENRKFQIGDFRMWNALWTKYKGIKETYENS